ncbi:MAG: 2'-5' RNA ligase family protein [Streptosporangiaceae bacterium]
MERQAVVIFPQGQLAVVEEFRRRWDPLGGSIPAHVTLVFPVSRPRREQDLARELAALLDGFPLFDLSLSEVQVWEQEYLFLVAGRGGEQVARLHDALYDGPFRHARQPSPLVPHMPIGRCLDSAELAAGAAEAVRLGVRAEVRAAAISVYRISHDGRRSQTLDVCLGGQG